MKNIEKLEIGALSEKIISIDDKINIY